MGVEVAVHTGGIHQVSREQNNVRTTMADADRFQILDQRIDDDRLLPRLRFEKWKSLTWSNEKTLVSLILSFPRGAQI
jgi:hypothetical protein